MQSFKEMDLVPALREALEIMKYETPTPVQAEAIPIVLEGSDLMACAQTGTGKTAAFALPLLMHMSDKNRNKGVRKSVLILAPTRELVEQIAEVLSQLTVKARHCKLALIIGGVGYNHQIRDLRANPSFIIATPGRLIDHLESGRVRLNDFGVLVLDEADRMLDMGFAPQLEEIVSRMPTDRQTLLFSATLDGEVGRIAKKYLRNPKSVNVAPAHTPIEKITQNVVRTLQKEKPSTLLKEIDKITGSIIIFTRTKARTEQVAKNLDAAGHEVQMIHGDRSQAQRKRALDLFRQGKARILVATDVAARGLDIPHIEHVFNYDLPMQPEDYIHRIGRTARAGREGDAWSFVTPDDEGQWNRIYKLMYGKFPEGAKRPGGGGGSRPWDRNQGRRTSSPSRNARNEQRASARGPSRPSSRPDVSSERPATMPGFGDRPRREDHVPRTTPRPQRAFQPEADERTFANRAERDAARASRPAKTETPKREVRTERPARSAAPKREERSERSETKAAPKAERAVARSIRESREQRSERPQRAERTSERPTAAAKPAMGGERRPQRTTEGETVRRSRDESFASASRPKSFRRNDDRPQARTEASRGGAGRPQRKGFAPPWAREKKETKPLSKPRHKSLV